jgi:Xaa-Pro aminopeptidase
MNVAQSAVKSGLPFDAQKLDQLLEEADIDVLLVTSKHNIHYLFGGYRFFFFDYMDAIGVSRYQPILIYRRGKPDQAAYIGYRMEMFEKELGKFWTPTFKTTSAGSADAARLAVEHLKTLGKLGRIGVEASFLPSDAAIVLRQGLGNGEFVDAQFPLERLRLVKTPHELDLLRQSSDKVVESMLTVFRDAAPGKTKLDLVDHLRREEVNRGLTFEYCLITAGTSLNRAPSDQKLKAGDIMSIDSGGNYHGYIGDLCRMGIVGEPDSELKDLLGFIDEIQQLARKPIRRGALGGEIFQVAEERLNASPHKPYVEFLAHGMGLVSHEGPRLTATGPVPYTAYDADRELEAGMVVSIETTMKHPTRGFIKLEDTVAVTDNGCEGFGDAGRGWNICGS